MSLRDVKPGETVTVTCSGCDTEFELTLEPKARRDKKSAASMESKGLVNCPFCMAEADSLESDELSEEDEEDIE